MLRNNSLILKGIRVVNPDRKKGTGSEPAKTGGLEASKSALTHYILSSWAWKSSKNGLCKTLLFVTFGFGRSSGCPRWKEWQSLVSLFGGFVQKRPVQVGRGSCSLFRVNHWICNVISFYIVCYNDALGSNETELASLHQNARTREARAVETAQPGKIKLKSVQSWCRTDWLISRRFGVCCFFAVSKSSSTVTQNNTYIQNPGYPTALTAADAKNAFTYDVKKVSDSEQRSYNVASMHKHWPSFPATFRYLHAPPRFWVFHHWRRHLIWWCRRLQRLLYRHKCRCKFKRFCSRLAKFHLFFSERENCHLSCHLRRQQWPAQ